VPKGYPGHENDACALNENIRALTTLERSLIQTFPATFKWVGNKTDIEQMIGNAVPVKLAEFVAKALKSCLCDGNNEASTNIENEINGFKKWLKEKNTYTDRSISDILSRLKRANCIRHIPVPLTPIYLYYIEQEDAYAKLTTSVKSQLKRAICCFMEYKR